MLHVVFWRLFVTKTEILENNLMGNFFIRLLILFKSFVRILNLKGVKLWTEKLRHFLC